MKLLRFAKPLIVLLAIAAGGWLFINFYSSNSRASRERMVNAEIAWVRKAMKVRMETFGSYNGSQGAADLRATISSQMTILNSAEQLDEKMRKRLPQEFLPKIDKLTYSIVIQDENDGGRLIVVTPDEVHYF